MKRPDGVTAIAVWFFVDALLGVVFRLYACWRSHSAG